MAAQGAAKVLVGAILVIFILGILVGELIDVIDGMRPGQSADFNNTMDDVETFAWLAAGFMALGILIWAGRYILALVQGF
jgi:hypothetical protein